ncbi:glycosyltransferase family 4 protein [Limnofasciculus baicalensis]|uniref:Glycosyltransferase family 4 protein n=1 Tax=Limnofasciculus baicalensis BBK-W-15 TaxID=2699891 RepID=A0AAE3GQF2_9CYAN|nr:glycosyltransferase family 4 protein [Limnofasciculus baicalensis]MCP2728629.1 glycosyltransferase family 4 protein [Limnofasciculus baicalensis BBK-W-15]
MKVLLVAYECAPNAGSEMASGWNWPLHLADLGHEVWVLNRMGKESTEKALASRPMSKIHWIYVDTPAWIKFCRRFAKNTTWLIGLSYLVWQKQAYKIARQLDEKQGFDLVHHITMANLSAGSQLCQLNKPFIFGPVGGGQLAPPAFKKYFINGWNIESFRAFIIKHLYQFNPLLNKTVKRSDLVLATNCDTAELAQKAGAKHVELFLDSGLLPDYLPDQPPTRSTATELRLLWLSRIIPRKGLLLALESLSKISHVIPFKLTIIGEGVLSHHISEWIEKFSLENQVDYLGSVPWREVIDKYRNSDVFLFTSLRDSFGSVVLEAMSQALPVIALDHHGVGDFLPSGAGIKVSVTNPPDTVNALADAVEWMYRNPDLRCEMGRIAYEFAKKQTWPEKAIDMSRYYEEIVADRNKKYTSV